MMIYFDTSPRLDTSLRTGDALHFAIAHNLAADKIVILDKGMLKAGKSLNLPVDQGIELPEN